ncbi:uncharacterized protein LOC133897676 [Phragmites australis]|uniref:uncharacterized protein LOC133897676 n=1 Tax=Phragmites australis TaxID=29695 RepID=UPI002D78202C|nr:uncharacterized protein LOC133897676 [Phragmites australis]
MERFAAMAAGRRADSASAPAPAEEEGKEKGKEEVANEKYLSIQLEEIVIVKNDDVASLGAAHGSNPFGGARGRVSASASMGQRGEAAAVRGAWSTTMAWIVGSN